MASAIDPSQPAGGVPSAKLDRRNDLQAARDQIEALQAGESGHQHVLAGAPRCAGWRPALCNHHRA